MKRILIGLLILLGSFGGVFEGIASGAQADETVFGGLIISDAWIKETSPNHPVTGGYLAITNTNNSEDRLLSVSSVFSKRSEVHQITVENDVMTMGAVKDGILIEAGQTTHLKPGGYHLMFMRLDRQMKPQDVHEVMLVFEKAGAVTISMTVDKTSRVFR